MGKSGVINQDFKGEENTAYLGHYSADFTQEIYVNTERVVYNADCEIIAFALEVLPKNNAAQLIPLDERYLLEVLP